MNATPSLALPFARLTPGAMTEQSVAAAVADPAARVIAVGADSSVSGDDAFALLFLPKGIDAAALAFLGHDRIGPLFACDRQRLASSDLTALAAVSALGGLRSLDWPDSGNRFDLLAFAQGLIAWHRSYPFCPHCGSGNLPSPGGHSRTCTNADCAKQLFPRTDPCVIALVERDQHILLGRRHGWDTGRFSTLAGFIESGESAEQALVREMQEEAGVSVHSWQYVASQPWPFPRSFMLGYIAQTDDMALTRDDDELAELRWWSIDELRGSIATGELRLPPRASIARHLIETWHQAKRGEPLTTDNRGNWT